jgi:CRP/FNR family transcriptional regulator
MPANAESLIAKLKAVPALAEVDDTVLAELAKGVQFHRIENGHQIFRAGEPATSCYIVSYGSVKLVRSPTPGKEIVMTFCRAGDFVGAAMMIQPNSRYPLSAVAIEDSGIIQIPRDIYAEKWMSQPTVARNVNLSIMSRMMEFQQDKAVSSLPVAHKIASFLLRQLDQQGADFGDRINLRLTRRDIAERVGTTVETVIRVLSAWSQKGWITTESQHISVVNRKAIEDFLAEKEK